MGHSRPLLGLVTFDRLAHTARWVGCGRVGANRALPSARDLALDLHPQPELRAVAAELADAAPNGRTVPAVAVWAGLAELQRNGELAQFLQQGYGVRQRPREPKSGEPVVLGARHGGNALAHGLQHSI
jgi:hypothetical protein